MSRCTHPRRSGHVDDVDRTLGDLKGELVDHERYATRAAAVTSIGDYIEQFYNKERRHSHLGYVSPIEYELRSQTAALAA